MVILSGGGMHARRAAQTVIEKLLNEQSRTPPRTRWERFRGLSPIGAQCTGWYLAALGEIAVGRELRTLASEWTVFHALPIGVDGWDIDQILVGPAGVVTINAKHHRGQSVQVDDGGIAVDGRPVPYLRHAEFEAEHVTTLLRDRSLSPPVMPAVVLVGTRKILIHNPPDSVTVIGSGELLSWLLSLPVVLDLDERMRIVELFDNPARWANVLVDTGDDLLERFFALDEDARSARRQHRFMFPLEIALASGIAITALGAASMVVGRVLMG